MRATRLLVVVAQFGEHIHRRYKIRIVVLAMVQCT
jgi:hypothetical protein